MPKRIEIVPAAGSTYFVPFDSAMQLTRRGDGKWEGNSRVILFADKSKRGVWEKKQSGHAGPLVLQLT